MVNGKGSENDPATRGDIIRVDKKIDKVAAEVIKNQARLEELRETVATKADISRILDAIDAFAQKGETYDRKAITHGGQLIEQTAALKSHAAALKDHAGRLKTLEAKA